MEKCNKPDCPKPRAAYVGTGRPPVYCDEHLPKKKRKAAGDAARAARAQQPPSEATPAREPRHKPEHELEHAAARDAHQRAAGRVIGTALHAFRAQKLAVYLDEHTNPIRAAELAGVEFSSEFDLAELVKEAAHYKGLTERKPEAIGAVLTKAMTIGAINMAATMSSATAAQLFNGLYRVAETLERIQGKAQSVFTALTTVYEMEGGERWKPEDLLPPEVLAPGPLRPGLKDRPIPPSELATSPSAPPNTDPVKKS